MGYSPYRILLVVWGKSYIVHPMFWPSTRKIIRSYIVCRKNWRIRIAKWLSAFAEIAKNLKAAKKLCTGKWIRFQYHISRIQLPDLGQDLPQETESVLGVGIIQDLSSELDKEADQDLRQEADLCLDIAQHLMPENVLDLRFICLHSNYLIWVAKIQTFDFCIFAWHSNDGD